MANRKLGMFLGAAGVLVLIGLFRGNDAPKTPAPTASTTAPAPPASPTTILSSSLPGDARPTQSRNGDELVVRFSLEPWSLTAGTMRNAFNMKSSEIIPKLFLSDPTIGKITIIGSAPFRDIKGHDSVEPLFRVTFSRANANSIVWDKISFRDLNKIADSAWAHPSAGW